MRAMYSPDSIWLSDGWLTFATVVTKLVLMIVIFLLFAYIFEKLEEITNKKEKHRKIKAKKLKEKELYRKRYKKQIERANYELKREIARIDQQNPYAERIKNASGRKRK